MRAAIKIERYRLKDGQAGWQVQLMNGNGARHQKIRRFSCADYGEHAFQKALDWLESNSY